MLVTTNSVINLDSQGGCNSRECSPVKNTSAQLAVVNFLDFLLERKCFPGVRGSLGHVWDWDFYLKTSC